MAKRLYVGNLNYQTTADGLTSVFEEYGEVSDVTVIEGKGFAFVEFTDDDSAAKAIEGLNGVDVDGREIRVDVANPRPARGGGGGGGGGYRGGGGGGGGGGYRGGGDRW
ncbi:RNA-binding protein [Candidatus Poribacteria bacterium]|jgi:cold-inducible RNA-binding protein|nr:RNA-binding protein [Candidatus Poribacteria bacterium]MBT5712001.1 RNA-binding protein [Candidatus Poribacteria bacterium]MBT7809400.1 RNA-binding protein [Candidatus Poribacteria bacterium]